MAQKDNLKRFGAHLKNIRSAKGLSLREMEYRGSLSRGYLSEVENGKKNISFTTLIKICVILELEPEELLKDFKAD